MRLDPVVEGSFFRATGKIDWTPRRKGKAQINNAGTQNTVQLPRNTGKGSSLFQGVQLEEDVAIFLTKQISKGGTEASWRKKGEDQ